MASALITSEEAALLAGARSVRVGFDAPRFGWAWFGFDWALEYAADLAGLKGREYRARRAVRECADTITSLAPSAYPYSGQYEEARKWAAVDALLAEYRTSKGRHADG